MKVNATKKENEGIKVVAEQNKHGHANWMDGVSYDIKNPLIQLRVVASTCFFGEPMYYHSDDQSSKFREKAEKPVNHQHSKHLTDVLGEGLSSPEYHSFSPSKLVETAIDEALNFDPEATLQEAVRLRNEEAIRTTPQVILVRAANHEKVRGTGLIGKYASQILKRADEPAVQMAYQMAVYGNPIPNSLKKAWKSYLEKLPEHTLAKYRMENKVCKTLDVVNMSHAHSEPIDKLMKGQLKIVDGATWENLISSKGASKENWEAAIPVMGHMALLRNLRNFSEHGVDKTLYLPKLLETAKKGAELPFRYYSAFNQLLEKGADAEVLAAVENCLMLSIKQMPTFKGRSMSLCDNSGSAQGAATSTMGTMKVSNIANLTAALTAFCSEQGEVGVFGDKLKIYQPNKSMSLLSQVNFMDELAKDIGMGTENGIWIFFRDAIKKKEVYDHIFIYSDMQAGHGGLYGTNPSEYSQYQWNDKRHIDVAKLIKDYRKNVNPDVMVYLVQVAGYKDTLAPEFYDKTYVLGGWGEGLLKFASSLSEVTQQKIVPQEYVEIPSPKAKKNKI